MSSRHLVHIFLGFAAVLTGCADRIEIDAAIPDREPSNDWSADLKKVATKKGIRFSELKSKQKNLNRFLAWASVHGQHSDTWRESKEDKRLVYLLNVHNAAVLHNLLRHDVPDSPDDVDVGLYQWDGAGFFWGSKYKVDGEWSALRHISFHDTVSRYQEPLLWVALYDGTRDSPPLGWWKRENLQAQLKTAMRKFVNSDRGLVATEGGWAANPLFIERADDFTFWTDATDICEWMAGYAKGERKTWLKEQAGNCNLTARTPNRSTDMAPPRASGHPPQAVPTTQVELGD